MTLTSDQAARFALWRQGLTELVREPLDAVSAVFAIQTQYAASLAVAVAARSSGAEPDWELRTPLTKSWTLRNTLHVHAQEDHALALAVLGPRIRRRYVEWMRRSRGLDDVGLARMEDAVRGALAGGPMTREQLHRAVPELRDIPHTGWGADVMGLAALGDLVLAFCPGPTRFALNDRTPSAPNPGDLLRRYLFAHGPATLADYRYWTGLTAVDARAAVASAGDAVTRVSLGGREAYIRTEDLDPLLDPPPPAIRWLAKFDPLTMGWLDKSRVLRPEWRTRVFRKAGQVEAALLVDGRIAGTWRSRRVGRNLQIHAEVWSDLGVRRRRAAETEADRLAVCLGLGGAEVTWEAAP